GGPGTLSARRRGRKGAAVGAIQYRFRRKGAVRPGCLLALPPDEGPPPCVGRPTGPVHGGQTRFHGDLEPQRPIEGPGLLPAAGSDGEPGEKDDAHEEDRGVDPSPLPPPLE